jgi:hypothetical protein
MPPVEPVALRPLNFGEVLDTSFNLFKRNFKAVLIVSVVIMVPIALLGAAAAAGLAPSDLSALDDPNADLDDILGIFGGFFGALGLGSLIQIMGSILVQAATTRIYSESTGADSMKAGDALRFGLRRAPAMLGLTLVTTIGSFLGLLLCSPPGSGCTRPGASHRQRSSPRPKGRSPHWDARSTWSRATGGGCSACWCWPTILVGVITSVVTAPLQFGVTFGAGIRGQPRRHLLRRLPGAQHTGHRTS